jgi:lysine/ornithine N-monooxygenase
MIARLITSVSPSATIAAPAQGNRLRLSVQSEHGAMPMETDHVIAATGYKVDIGRLAFLDPPLRSEIKVLRGARY